MSNIICFECHLYLCVEAFKSLDAFVSSSFARKLSGACTLCAYHNEKLFLKTLLKSFKQENPQLLMLYEEKNESSGDEGEVASSGGYIFNLGKTV